MPDAAPDKTSAAGGRVYWADNTTGAILVVGVDGGTPAPLATGMSFPSSIATDGTSIYCANHGNGTIEKVSIDAEAGAPSMLLAFAQDNVWTLAVGGGSVFWVALGPLDLSVIAQGQQRPGYVAVDDTYVYWTDPLAGTVMKWKK